MVAKSTQRASYPKSCTFLRREAGFFWGVGVPKLSLYSLGVPSDGERQAVPQGERPKPRPHPRPPEVD